jgi:hypothetical protein
MKKATSKFSVTGWEEKPFSEVEGGPKLTHAHVTMKFEGDIDGEGVIDYLMVYHADGNTDYNGIQRIVGSLGGRKGSFVLEHHGRDDGHAARSDYSVVPGSGTGELAGLRGKGGGVAERNEGAIPFDLEYEFP